MMPPAISVPVAMLLTRELPPTAKLVWMVAQLDLAAKQLDSLADRLDWATIQPDAPPGPRTIARRSGLSLPTVWQGLAQSAAAGWPVPAPPPGTRASHLTRTHVTMPIHLLTHQAIGVQAKLLYGILQCSPHNVPHTYAELSLLTGTGLNTVKRAVHQLTQTGWLQVTQPHKRAPLQIVLANPETDRAVAEAAAAKRRIDRALYKGEAIMREYLTLLVDATDYEDDAAPSCLRNPLSGVPLQLDRYYPPHVAFEFQGAQHDGPTERFPSQDEANEQQARDLMKLGLCTTHAITLVQVHAEDLSLEGMQQKIGCLLPLRSLAGHGRLVAYLEARAHGHRQEAARGGRPA